MKKTLFIALLFACASLISCSKKDDEPTPEPEYVVPIDFVTFVMKDQSKYVDQSFTINVNGKSVTFNLSEMTEAKASDYPSIKKEVENQLDKVHRSIDSCKVYKYSVGSIKTNQEAYGEKTTFKIKEDRPGTETCDILLAYFIEPTIKKVPGTIEDKNTIETHMGVYNDTESLDKFFNLVSKSFPKSFSFKFY